MTKPLITELDIHAMRDLLERTRPQHSPEDHACLADTVEIFAEVMALVSESEDDDALVDEALLAQAIKRARARKSR